MIEEDQAEAVADAAAEQTEPVVEAPAAPAAEVEPVADQAIAMVAPMAVPWWPFLVELGVWGAFVGVSAWQLWLASAKGPMFASTVYPFTLLGGLVLTAAGPALILAVWISQLGGPEGRGARFVSALVKGSVITLAGAAMWWGTLAALDFVRLGRLF